MLHWTKKTDIAVQELTNKLIASSIVMCCSQGSNQIHQVLVTKRAASMPRLWMKPLILCELNFWWLSYWGFGFCEEYQVPKSILIYHHPRCCRCSQICQVSPLRNSSHPQFGRDEQEIHIFQINLISSHCVKDVLPIYSNSLTSYIHVYATWFFTNCSHQYCSPQISSLSSINYQLFLMDFHPTHPTFGNHRLQATPTKRHEPMRTMLRPPTSGRRHQKDTQRTDVQDDNSRYPAW